MVGFGLRSGNGAVKGDAGVSVSLAQFNGADNNIPLAIGVGNGLDWNAWHRITLAANLASDEWHSITVNGVTESLAGHPLPRAFSGSGPIRPTTFDARTLEVVNQENFGDESSDSIYWDNVGVHVEYVPEPPALDLLGLCLSLTWVRWACRHSARTVA
ncbi:MAG: hypothetical protein CMJ58_00005 [Planctomycetaceae bacterium]|nr:hypothetical protein [Planctomycetaceae bacterium]